MIEIVCKNCGTKFKRHKSRRAKYCSSKCSEDHKRRRIIHDFKEETKESCYWAGFIFGDGCLNKNKLQICLSNLDGGYNLQHLQKFSNYVFGTDNVNKYDSTIHIQVNSNEIANNLRKYGITENKTYNSELILPRRHKLDFIRGFFDADGWISIGNQWNENYQKYYKRYCLGVCSYLRNNLKKISQELPHPGRLNKKKSQELYELRFGSLSQIIDIRDSIQGNIQLESKWHKLKRLEIPTVKTDGKN